MMKSFVFCAIGLACLTVVCILIGLPQYHLLPLQPGGIHPMADTPDGLPGLTSTVRLDSRQFRWGFPFETVLYINFEDDDVRQNWEIVGQAWVEEVAPYRMRVGDGIGCPGDRGSSTITMTGLENGHTYLVEMYFIPTSDEYLDDRDKMDQLRREGKSEQAAEIVEKWQRYANDWDDRVSCGTIVRLVDPYAE